MSDQDLRVPLTGAAAKIHRFAGEEAAEKILSAYGGTRFYVPRNVGLRSKLTTLVGIEAARKIAAAFEPGWYNIQSRSSARPMLKQRILATEGTTAEIARRLGCSSSYVKMVRRNGRDP